MLALRLLASADAGEAPKHVLVLYSLGREFSPFNVMAGTFRTELAQRSPTPIEFHEVTLETARSSEPVNEQPLVDYLQTMFSNRRLDLIVTLGGPATLFMNGYRKQLFSEVPMIATMDLRRVAEAGIPTNVAVVPLQLNPRGLIEDILQVLPATTNIVVVLGATRLSWYWAEQCKREFAPFTNRIEFRYYNNLSLAQMRDAVRVLPLNSAILYGGVVMDAAGVPHEQEAALVALHASANAPCFGVYEHQLGTGIVGGRLVSNEAWGQRVAATALRILQGEEAGRIISEPTKPGKPVYDWRELQRWGIDARRLPPDAEIRFREPPIWREHAPAITVTLGVLILQAWLIGRLLMQRRRRQRVESELRESERRFRSLADTAPVMIWMSGPDQQYTYFNRRWLDFTGRPHQAEVGDGWIDNVHPDDMRARVEGYREAFAACRPFTAEYRLRRHDGQFRWMLAHALPRLTSDGALLGYVGSCVDITDRKQVEEANRHLAHVARVSTMGHLASALAHELNQPLGAILRNAEAGELIMRQTSPDYEEVRAILEDIRKDDQRAGAVIDRMRSFLQRRPLELAVLPLDGLFEQVAALVRPELRGRHVALHVEPPAEPLTVWGDPVQLQQVLINLLMNGADAMTGMADDNRCLDLTARLVTPETVEVAVRDAGHGIPESKLAAVFDPFFSTKANGLGLGLAISKTIIEAHGGRIWAGSNPEGGAVFKFTLKIAA